MPAWPLTCYPLSSAYYMLKLQTLLPCSACHQNVFKALIVFSMAEGIRSAIE